MRTLAQKRRAKRGGLLVNGYPDGEHAAWRERVYERWLRLREHKRQKENRVRQTSPSPGDDGK